jgi:octaheme c-type cytochrome (tetrathionate reductase family)
LQCTDCHEADRHRIIGKAFSVSSANEDRMNCEKCHTETPHQNKILNTHIARIACQTCHIPVYAKGVPTKMKWDWSTTGKLDKMGKKINEHDSLGNHTYSTEKGSFEWKTNVEPDYVWFNGTAEQYKYGDVIEDTSKVLQVNKFFGSYDDPKSKIVPVKIHRGKQIYDPVNKMLITPHIYGHDSTAYKTSLDWNLSAEVGMKEAGLPYSGKYAFIETEMYWKINHMVAEADKALSCKDCHAREGRLKNVAGFYMPGRDRSAIFDIFGVVMVTFTIIGVSIHSLIRYIKKDCIACDN